MKIHINHMIFFKDNKLVFLFFILFYNCTFTEKPTFVGIENIKIVDSNIKTITLNSEALFYNHNDVSGQLETKDLKVYINDSEVAQFKTEKFEVPKKKEFTIPLTIEIKTDSIINNKSLGGLLGSFVSQQLKVQYKGSLNYKIFGYSSSYPVDVTQTLKLKL